MGTNIGFALALAGSIKRRLPFWPNLKLQAAGVFSNLALPFGSQALQVRFLQKQGVDAATAVAAGGIVNLAAGTVDADRAVLPRRSRRRRARSTSARSRPAPWSPCWLW